MKRGLALGVPAAAGIGGVDISLGACVALAQQRTIGCSAILGLTGPLTSARIRMLTSHRILHGFGGGTQDCRAESRQVAVNGIDASANSSLTQKNMSLEMKTGQ